jgi:hypothetical protein
LVLLDDQNIAPRWGARTVVRDGYKHPPPTGAKPLHPQSRLRLRRVSARIVRVFALRADRVPRRGRIGLCPQGTGREGLCPRRGRMFIAIAANSPGAPAGRDVLRGPGKAAERKPGRRKAVPGVGKIPCRTWENFPVHLSRRLKDAVSVGPNTWHGPCK